MTFRAERVYLILKRGKKEMYTMVGLGYAFEDFTIGRLSMSSTVTSTSRVKPYR